VLKCNPPVNGLMDNKANIEKRNSFTFPNIENIIKSIKSLEISVNSTFNEYSNLAFSISERLNSFSK
jgi:uncharacterized 2Fe-2S/4Fe-4S cluster protein (DUF4445 family)